jgi:hypothetical protein
LFFVVFDPRRISLSTLLGFTHLLSPTPLHFLNDLPTPACVQGVHARKTVNDIHIAPAQPAMNLHLYWHAEQKYPKLTQFGQLWIWSKIISSLGDGG